MLRLLKIKDTGQCINTHACALPIFKYVIPAISRQLRLQACRMVGVARQFVQVHFSHTESKLTYSTQSRQGSQHADYKTSQFSRYTLVKSIPANYSPKISSVKTASNSILLFGDTPSEALGCDGSVLWPGQTASKEQPLSANNHHLDSPLWNTVPYNFGTVISRFVQPFLYCLCLFQCSHPSSSRITRFYFW